MKTMKMSVTETMKELTLPKGEFVNIINGLFEVQNLEGKKFSLAVSKNITILRSTLQDVEDLGKPSPEFMALSEQVQAIALKNEEDAKEQVEKLEADNIEIVDARRNQLEVIQEILKDSISVVLHTISEQSLPENITAQQINKLTPIIN
jgi:hypothetical protein